MRFNLKYRLFSILLICVITFNTVHYTKVEANSLAVTLASVVASGGGAAAFGSAALGIAVPLLLAAGTAYAGYKIYQNREQIMSTFHNWYTSSSTTIKNWCNEISAAIDDGSLSDGDTITIPKNVVQEVGRFYTENTITGDITSISGNSIPIASMSQKVYLPNLTTALETNKVASFAPVLHIKHNNIDTTSDIQEYIVYGKSNTSVGMIIYQMMSANGTTYWYLDYIDRESITDNSLLSLTSGRMESIFTKDSYISTTSNRAVMPSGNIHFDGNTITADTWNYSIDLYLPETSFLAYVPYTLSATYSYTSSNSYQGLYQNILERSQYQILHNGTSTTSITQDIATHGLTYTPSAWVGNNADALEVTLTPDVVNALNDYIVTKKTNEVDLIQTIDPTGFIVDSPTDGETDNGVVDNILDGIKDVFSNPLASILEFFQKILDAILAIPSAIIAIPESFTSWWEKLWEKIQDIIDTILSLPGTFVNSLQDVLRWLFVPDTIAINDYVLTLENTVNSRYGILTYPLSLVIRFLNELNTVGNKDCILIIPQIEFKGHTLMEEYQFNFTQYVKKSEFREIYDYYQLFSNFILILAVINLAIKKGSEIIRGN